MKQPIEVEYDTKVEVSDLDLKTQVVFRPQERNSVIIYKGNQAIQFETMHEAQNWIESAGKMLDKAWSVDGEIAQGRHAIHKVQEKYQGDADGQETGDTE